MANQGQVKHMVRMAALAIKLAKQNNPALLILQDKVDELWSFALSLPMTGNFVPCNQGQLKHIALTFYELLRTAVRATEVCYFQPMGKRH